MAYRVSKEEFEKLVERALEELPPQFAAALEEMSVEILPVPAPGDLAAARVRRGGLLLGLYRGRPLTQRSVEDSGALPDRIDIFQHPIELVCDSEDSLVRQVRITVLHEIGHHFGMDEDDLKKLGYG